MTSRFADLKKVPKEPAARLLAVANMRLETKVKAPASAKVEQILTELETEGALIDMLRILSVALPPRERTWWACLAARDVVGAKDTAPPRSLLAAESWVLKPNDDTRAAARTALDAAEQDDETTLCAMAAALADGTLGPGELAHHAAPPGAAEAAAFGMNVMALGTVDDFSEGANRLIDRALDIARGGNGKGAKGQLAAEEKT
ncbi:MAG: hypothetical protein KDE08_05035 [Rhodobacteraceae bacterium]|nr:hypothetical protein [Paracoccaceae bacterium]